MSSAFCDIIVYAEYVQSAQIIYSCQNKLNFIVGFFVQSFSSNSIILHAYGAFSITGDGLQIRTYAQHSWTFIRDSSSSVKLSLPDFTTQAWNFKQVFKLQESISLKVISCESMQMGRFDNLSQFLNDPGIIFKNDSLYLYILKENIDLQIGL